jgi:hypothetical protein
MTYRVADEVRLLRTMLIWLASTVAIRPFCCPLVQKPVPGYVETSLATEAC